ncbi:MAG: hypothetical protein WBM50_12320 [Acidimicrobiales bacterium]
MVAIEPGAQVGVSDVLVAVSNQKRSGPADGQLLDEPPGVDLVVGDLAEGVTSPLDRVVDSRVDAGTSVQLGNEDVSRFRRMGQGQKDEALA